MKKTNLFELYATISLNSKGFTQALQGAEKGVFNLGKSLLNTQLLIKGVEAAFGAIKNVVSQGVSEFGRYEQLLGGIQTMFIENNKVSAESAKNAYEAMVGYANDAYKTAGLSANEYMETATSFSASLIQGLKGDTEKAAELANTAITDMADNANKLGTDMTAIQNAYQGFAKGNFTMLDNLKLGYGGTKTEMVRLINDSGVLDKKIKSIDEVSFDQMIAAIHKIQEEMGITGTTAQEAASTIEGSRNSLHAAFQNLLTFVTDGTDKESIQKAQDAFVESFANYFNDNLEPAIERGLSGSGDVFFAVSKALLSIPEDTLANLAKAGMTSATDLLGAATEVAGWLIDQLGTAFSDTELTGKKSNELGQAIGGFISTTLVKLAEDLPTFVVGLLTSGVSIATGIIQGIIDGFTGEGEGTVAGYLKDVDKEANEGTEEAYKAAIEANGIINYLDALQQKYGEAATQTDAWKEAIERLTSLDDSFSAFFDAETGKMTTSTQAIRDHVKALREEAIERAALNAVESKMQTIADLTVQRTDAEFALMDSQSQKAAAVDAAREFIGGGFTDALTEDVETNIINSLMAGRGWTTENINANPEIYKTDMQSVVDALESFKSDYGIKTGDTLTDQQVFELAKRLGETALDDETLDKNRAAVDALTEQYNDAEKAIKTNQDTITAIDADIKNAEASLQRSYEALDKLTASAMSTSTAIGTLKANAPNYNKPGVHRFGAGSSDWEPEGSFATGLGRVPYDGFKAELHRDEAVLTAADAKEWRNGGKEGIDTRVLANTVEQAIKDGMASVGFYFDREQVAAAITSEVSKNIAQGVAAWGYS